MPNPMLWVDPVTSAMRFFSSIQTPPLAMVGNPSYLNKLDDQFQTHVVFFPVRVSFSGFGEFYVLRFKACQHNPVWHLLCLVLMTMSQAKAGGCSKWHPAQPLDR
jgi:hypothetical protein